jgi:exodeoxyribonuclease V alpha subunit
VSDARLESLLQRGELEVIDVELACALTALGGKTSADADRTAARSITNGTGASAAHDEDLALAIALTNRAVRDGHTCLDLTRVVPPASWSTETATGAWPSPATLIAAVRASSLVRVVSDHSAAAPSTRWGVAPLVLRGVQLYLQRFDVLEARLAAAVQRRLARGVFPPHTSDATHLALLFPERADDPAQCAAAELALTSPLTVITGGPGTGKTFTVLRLLTALLARTDEGSLPEIALLAPTGKAASRLTESVRDGVSTLATGVLDESQRRAIPASADTIHRALGVHPDHPHRPRHHAGNPLPADIVVVDETSMVDLPLIARLFEAVREDARLILLGDADQLASVDAGAVLRDLVDAPVMHAHIARLVRSRRFDPTSPLGALVHALRGDDRAALRAALSATTEAAMSVQVVHDRGDLVPAAVLDAVRAHTARLAAAPTPEHALRVLSEWRLLTALRRGATGADAINAMLMAEQGGQLRRGTPVLIVANAPDDALANGDLGVAWDAPNGQRVVLFPGADGPRAVSERRLPRWEPAFAMTVHKAQGSEFDHVQVLLPPPPSPLLTRELLYTAVSRAKVSVTIVAPEGAIEAAHARRVERATGLRERLRATMTSD